MMGVSPRAVSVSITPRRFVSGGDGAGVHGGIASTVGGRTICIDCA